MLSPVFICELLYSPFFRILPQRTPVNLPFLTAGFLIKLIFFAAKGFGKEYAAGIKNGVSLAFKGSRNGKKMRFSWKHLKNYGKIQLQLWANIVRRITG